MTCAGTSSISAPSLCFIGHVTLTSFSGFMAEMENAEGKAQNFYSSLTRGTIGSSKTSFGGYDGFRQFSAAAGHARSYRSATVLPHSSCFPVSNGTGQLPRKSIRSLHTTDVRSARIGNRPLSPHLPVKKPQLSAVYSISHRIFGAALGGAILFVPLATRFSLLYAA